ncbi:hypothetical protein COEREDRAFT_8065 [Coemansia reversa NRRL 1564]|uniref:Transferase n=1 Tax=Coemansia reversa (strain ATCC 12441 / NRRL 1564) TaxID=763665 RepID=A0A2G5BD27_COERN|nr:hypothetical protein COEREDRAFT_8065 [Coemansia reversa NRRL 1564]|eukprot:PIA16924.1 hypothetical protein COEREDRAFT_8065 [Coemansia reversa NRRL 1564]
MEEYVNSIKSQIIPLSVIDTQGSFSNIPFVFFYENKENSDDFMPSEKLHNSFFRTMQCFPVFAGRINSTGIGNVSVVVDANDINTPEYIEDTSNIPFSRLKDAGFNWSAWPKGVATAGPMTCAGVDGEIKLINVHVIRLKNNSGLLIYLSIPHYILDGEGHMEVMRRWCQIYRLMDSGRLSAVDELPVYTFDRAILQQNLSDKRSPVDSMTYKTFTESSYLSEWFAWISPKLRGYILSKAIELQHTEAHLFHVSNKSFASLRELLRSYIPDIDTVSVNQLLLSLATKTLAQSQMVADGRTFDDGVVADDALLPVAVIFETREQLGIENTKYIGNVLMPKITTPSMKKLETPTNAESLASTLSTFNDTVNNIGPPLVASHIEMVSNRPSCFTRPITRFVRSKTAMSFVYDVMPDMYVADFGNGRPEWVSPIQPFRANAVLLLTSHDTTDGVDVFMTAFPKVMKEVLRNEFWTSIAKIIY